MEARRKRAGTVIAEYVLDACAIIALMTDEVGAGVVYDVIDRAYTGKSLVYMNKLNLLEVYYGLYREYGRIFAGETLADIKRLPIAIISEMTDAVFEESARLKANYKISLADSIALAEASVSGASLITSDHHELDIIDQNEKIHFLWIR